MTSFTTTTTTNMQHLNARPMASGYVYHTETPNEWYVVAGTETVPLQGARVCGGEPGTEDYDEGTVVPHYPDGMDGDPLLVTDGGVEVAWDSGIRTWTPLSLLELL